MGHRKAYDGPDQPCYIRVMTIAIAHHWQPITDLPENWQVMADPTLPVLAEEWRKGREAVGDSSEIRRFNAELLREVAIETGLIEGLYSIDRGTTETLIRMGLIKEELAQGIIDRSPDEIMPILEDQHSATEGLFDFVKQKRDLDISYIKELHAHLTRHQPSTTALTTDGRRVEIPLLRGEWKAQPNNPRREDGSIHEYCPPEHVAAEMDRLVEMHLAHETAGVAPDVSAAWLHHRFTQIHPFQDGNGRVARSLASLVFLRAGWFLFGVNRDERDAYIDALEAADRGKELPLIQLLASMQSKWMRRALTAISRAEASEFTEKELWKKLDERLSERRGIRHDDNNFKSLSGIFDRIEFEMNNFFPENTFNTRVLKSSVRYKKKKTDDQLTRQLVVGHHRLEKKYLLGGFFYDDDAGQFGSIVPFYYAGDLPSFPDEALELNNQLNAEDIARWARTTLKWLALEWERRR